MSSNIPLGTELAIQVIVAICIGTLVRAPSTTYLRAALPDQLGVVICWCWIVDVVLRHLRVPPINTGLSPLSEIGCSRFGDQIEIIDVFPIYVVRLDWIRSVIKGEDEGIRYDMLPVTRRSCRTSCVCQSGIPCQCFGGMLSAVSVDARENSVDEGGVGLRRRNSSKCKTGAKGQKRCICRKSHCGGLALSINEFER